MSPAETAELSAALRQSPELQRQLLILAGLEEGLAEAFQQEGARPQAPARPLAWTRFAWWPLAAAAALVACVGGVNLWQARQAEQAVVATLVEARGEVAGERVQGSGFRVQGSGGRVQGVRSPAPPSTPARACRLAPTAT